MRRLRDPFGRRHGAADDDDEVWEDGLSRGVAVLGVLLLAGLLVALVLGLLVLMALPVLDLLGELYRFLRGDWDL